MPNVVLVAPGFVEAGLKERLPALGHFAERGRVRRLAPLPPKTAPEALFLGLRPEQAEIADGPLIVSALGADPPARSTHFHLSLMSLQGDRIGLPEAIEPREAKEIAALLSKLDTKRLTCLPGPLRDHGLVWEGRGEWGTARAADVVGQEYRSVLPQGDFETALRSLIDSSVDMLSELELNARRLDEERPPLNLLWPWGQGERPELPNLALARGQAGMVESSSMRMAGLTRLVGYRHHALPGEEVDWRAVAERVLGRDASVVMIDGFETADEERNAWLARQIDERLISPLIENPAIRLSFAAPGGNGGLVVDNGGRNDVPLRLETVENTGLAAWDVWQIVDETLI